MAEEIKKTEVNSEQDPNKRSEEEAKIDEAEYKKVLSESIGRKNRIKEIESELTKLQNEKLTDSEKEQAKLKELESENDGYKSKLKSIELSSAILKAASGKGFVDLEAVELLAMKELASSDEVDPKEVAKVIDKLAKDKPYLIKGENTAAPGSGNFEKSNQEPAKDVDSMMRDFLHS